MDDRSIARFQMFGRVITFSRANISAIQSTEAPQHIDAVESVYIDLGKAKAGQAGGSVAARTVLLDTLRLDLQHITRTASAAAQDDPTFAKLFRPPAQLNPTAIITAADTIIANLIGGPADDEKAMVLKKGRVTRLIELGLPDNFMQTLTDTRAAIDAAQTAENQLDSEGVQNTALIGKLIADGMKHVHYLDAIFRNVYRQNPEKLQAWLSASHVERAAHHETKPTETSAQPAQPAEPPATAKS